MKQNIYVLSDLHGHFDIFIKMLEKINFSDDDELYILGDCCDRGEDSLKIYMYIEQYPNIHLIKGNHELLMRDAFKAGDVNTSQGRLWFQNGGNKTCTSYHQYLHKKAFNEYDYQVLKAAFYKMMIDYIDRCPSFIEIKCNNQDYVLIHAGINPEKDLYHQTEEECAWMREYFFMSKGLDNKIIIFGHTPTCYLHHDSSCFDIWYDPIYEDKIGIDGGLGPFDKGQLNCLCLNTNEVFVVKKEK